jgi:hypothetical protein
MCCSLLGVLSDGVELDESTVTLLLAHLQAAEQQEGEEETDASSGGSSGSSSRSRAVGGGDATNPATIDAGPGGADAGVEETLAEEQSGPAGS